MRYKTWGHQIINNWAELTPICCHNEFSNSLPTRTPTVGAKTITFARNCANAIHYTEKCPRGTVLHFSKITKLLQFSYFCPSINEYTPFCKSTQWPDACWWSRQLTRFDQNQSLELIGRHLSQISISTHHYLVTRSLYTVSYPCKRAPFSSGPPTRVRWGRRWGEVLIAIPVCNRNQKVRPI